MATAAQTRAYRARKAAGLVNGRPKEPLIDERARETDPSWRDEAACRHVDSAVFYGLDDGVGRAEGSQNSHVRAAKRICAGCPSVEPCLAFALALGGPGVWGSTSEGERKRMRRAQRGAR